MRGTCGLVALAVFGLAMVPVFAQRPARDSVEESVDRGLDFLKLLQDQEGSWSFSGQASLAHTSLATLAFLSAGHVPDDGPHGDVALKASRWILERQQPNGVFATETGLEMYHHGITTLLLTQLVGMLDKEQAGPLRTKLNRAVEVILKAQVAHPGPHVGGWRYRHDSTDADVSVTGWQILALRGARNVGCDVPRVSVEKALAYLDRCRDAASGGYGYFPGHSPSVGCTGAAILVAELLGKDKHLARESLQAGSFLLKNPIDFNERHFFYTAYYGSQAMFQLGNNYWNAFRPHLHKQLLSRQQRNGSWIGPDNYGPIYATSMAILAMTVEYRLLPIYQRGDDSEGKKK